MLSTLAQQVRETEGAAACCTSAISAAWRHLPAPSGGHATGSYPHRTLARPSRGSLYCNIEYCLDWSRFIGGPGTIGKDECDFVGARLE